MKYTSPTSEFIQQLKTERPHLEIDQQKGRALLWDKQINLDTQQQFKQATVKQKPYVYQPD